MSVKFVDRKGYGEDDYRTALKVIEARLVKVDIRDPELFMQFLPIRDALHKLLALYEKARDLREAAEAPPAPERESR